MVAAVASSDHNTHHIAVAGDDKRVAGHAYHNILHASPVPFEVATREPSSALEVERRSSRRACHKAEPFEAASGEALEGLS